MYFLHEMYDTPFQNSWCECMDFHFLFHGIKVERAPMSFYETWLHTYALKMHIFFNWFRYAIIAIIQSILTLLVFPLILHFLNDWITNQRWLVVQSFAISPSNFVLSVACNREPTKQAKKNHNKLRFKNKKKEDKNEIKKNEK